MKLNFRYVFFFVFLQLDIADHVFVGHEVEKA